MKCGEKNLLKKAVGFITKDTGNKNESKKLIVVIRIILLSALVYFVANLVLCQSAFLDKNGLLFYWSFFIILIFIGIFILSYYAKTLFVLWLFNIGSISWICAIVHFWGWDTGVQNFLMVLLILYFFSSYEQYVGKICYALGLCIFRIFLFHAYRHKLPIWNLGTSEENMLQMLSTITIFWCLSVIGYVFSKDSQDLEGKLVEYNNQLKQQADTDTLTGLPNRRRAMEYMENLANYSNLNNGFSFCICDIDFFKKVNDNYGHDFGDVVLKEISKIFKEEVNGKNFSARWGGEEFILLFPGCNGDDAYVKLEKLRRRIKETKIKKDDLEISITMTFGLTEYDFKGGLEATIKEADNKLYMGKEKGRDIIIY